MQLETQELLAVRGFGHYEVSAYAQPARRSRHNLNYWEFGDYIGIGAGAHGKLTCVRQHTGDLEISRTTRVRQPREYLQRAPGSRIARREAVEPTDLPFEFMLNVLRLVEGFDQACFKERPGLAFAALTEPIAAAVHRNLLEQVATARWRATALGQRFLNDLQAIFLPDAPRSGAGRSGRSDFGTDSHRVVNSRASS